MEFATVGTVLIGLLVGGGIVGVPVSLPPLAPDATVLRAIPEECLLLFTSAGTAEPDAKSANQTEQLMAEKEVQEFLGQMGAQINGALKQAASRNPQMEPLVKLAAPAAGLLLTRPTAFYVSHFEPQASGPALVRAGLIVNCGKRTAEAKKMLAELEAMATQNGMPAQALSDVKLGGAELRQLKLSPVKEFAWGFRGNYLLFTVGPDTAKELLDRIGSKGEPADWLVALQKQMGIQRPSTLGYANVAKLLQNIFTISPDPGAKAVLDALGVSQIKVAAVSSGLDKTGIVTRAFANLDGSPQGLFELVPAQPLTAADFQRVPLDASLAAVFRLDLATAFRRVLEQGGKVDPQAVAEIKGNLAGIEQGLGFQVQRDLLGSLGDLWTLFDAPGEGAAPWTGLILELSVRNRAKLADVQDRLLKGLRPAGAPGGPPFTIRQSMLGNVQVNQVVPNGPIPIAPAWCLLEDRLVVAATLESLKVQIARPAKAPSLADAKAVSVRLNSKQPPAALLYQDTRKALRSTYGMVQTLAPMASGALAQQGVEFTLPPLPSLESLNPHIQPLVQFVRRTKQGVLLERHQTFPLGGNEGAVGAGVVALLLPAVQAAREAARSNMSTNNMKMIALAAFNHHDVYKHFPARAITDKNGKPLLSWRVAILPYVEETVLYKQFHLDEPWDSPHNKQLIATMPIVYQDPSQPDQQPGRTPYQAPDVKDAIFGDKKEGRNMREITDGLSKTILIVETDAKHAVEWTKPDDFHVDPKNPSAGLKVGHGGAFYAAWGDGSVRGLPITIDPDVLKALFTGSGGEKVALPADE